MCLKRALLRSFLFLFHVEHLFSLPLPSLLNKTISVIEGETISVIAGRSITVIAGRSPAIYSSPPYRHCCAKGYPSLLRLRGNLLSMPSGKQIPETSSGMTKSSSTTFRNILTILKYLLVKHRKYERPEQWSLVYND